MKEKMGKSLSLNPWVTIWTKPRETIRAIVNFNPNYHLFLLSGIYGFTLFFQIAQNFSLGQTLSPVLIVGLALVLSVLIGFISFSITSALILWCGKWIGGTASFKEIRASLAWSNVTNIVSGVLWIVLLFSFGQAIFCDTFPQTPFVPSEFALVLSVFVIQLVMSVWSIVILLKSLAEVQGFSIWKAFLNVVLAFVILFVCWWIVGWLWS